MNEKNWWKIAVIVIAALALFWGGFYIGRQRDPEVITKTEIKYVELPPIHDSIPKPVPYKVVEPVDSMNIIMEAKMSGLLAELFPNEGKDTVYVTEKDTTAALRDWATERRYKETLFDSDTLGHFSFDAMVKYNRLASFDYTFIPVQKQTETTIKTTRKFLPYLGAGIATDGALMGQGGMFFHQDAGFAVQYRYDTKLKQNSVGAMFLYMF
jgi:hypothetical protein